MMQLSYKTYRPAGTRFHSHQLRIITKTPATITPQQPDAGTFFCSRYVVRIT